MLTHVPCLVYVDVLFGFKHYGYCLLFERGDHVGALELLEICRVQRGVTAGLSTVLFDFGDREFRNCNGGRRSIGMLLQDDYLHDVEHTKIETSICTKNKPQLVCLHGKPFLNLEEKKLRRSTL